MKLKFITLLAVLAFGSGGIVGAVHAQDNETVKANIPFDFYAGKQKMSAGRYRIGINLETDRISFTDESGKPKMFLMGTPEGYGDGKALLVFTHSGDVYALDELKSDAFSWVFQNRVLEPPMLSRNALSRVEVALNR